VPVSLIYWRRAVSGPVSEAMAKVLLNGVTGEVESWVEIMCLRRGLSPEGSTEN
jgi:hypothetical protein